MFSHVIRSVLFNDGRGVRVRKQHVTAEFKKWVHQGTGATCIRGIFQVKAP
jgi:hypothetical protein